MQGGLHAQLRTGLHSLGLYPLLEALKAGRTWRQALFQLHSSWQTCSGASSRCAVAAGELTARQARGWLNAPVEIWILLALGLQLLMPRWHLPTKGCVGLAVKIAKKPQIKDLKTPRIGKHTGDDVM